MTEDQFLTGDALRASLRGSDCLAAEAAMQGLTEEEALERLVAIADRAKRHWLLYQLHAVLTNDQGGDAA